jgi:hypothetical protein
MTLSVLDTSNVTSIWQGVEDGRYWARTSDLQLVERWQGLVSSSLISIVWLVHAVLRGIGVGVLSTLFAPRIVTLLSPSSSQAREGTSNHAGV